MPEELAPPVVAVVVTSDPGERFEACLGSLRDQDYPNLAVMVVDDASAHDLTARVAVVEPSAVVRRRRERGGYAAGCNEAVLGVEGAAFFLFCHDDVVLSPDVTRVLVAESFRMNASVVSPKYVSIDDPSRLLQVGLSMDRLGRPVPRVERLELDQEQHDEAREVFIAPGGCTLVRADLFYALEGFDAEMRSFGEDLDFSWRAQVAGGRVAVAPLARVAHAETAASGGRVDDAAGLQRRHELRAALKNYGRLRRWAVVVQLLVLSAGEMLVAGLGRDRERSRRVVGAWRWNLSKRQSLKGARRALQELRQCSDRTLRSRMTGRGRLYRLVDRYLISPIGSRHVRRAPERFESWWARAEHGELPTAQVVAVVAIVVLFLFGVRDLLLTRLPEIGDLVALPRGSSLLSDYATGITAGGHRVAAPAGFLPLGLVSLVLGNSSALALKVIALGAVLVGAAGVSRLVKPFRSSRGRLVGAASFVAFPLVWNAFATGDLEALVAMAALPYVISRLGRASGLEPFAERPSRGAGALVSQAVPLGLLLAVLVALSPPALLSAGVVLATTVVAALVQGEPRAGFRAAVIGLLATAVAFLCLLPWSATWVAHASWSAFSGAVPGHAVTPASLLRGHVGPVGASWGAFGLVLAAAYVLVVGRERRFYWAATFSLVTLGSVAFSWAGSEGWLGRGGGAVAVLAAPAAVGVAACCGLGAAALEKDVLRRTGLGWRQATAGLAALACIVGASPALGAALSGRGELPGHGLDSELSLPGRHPAYEVLWLGDPRALPGHGDELAPGLSWYLARPVAGASELWPPSNEGDFGGVARALTAARSGRTADLGSVLARYGVRYVVVASANAPEFTGTGPSAEVALPPAGLRTLLADQPDLVPLPVEAGATVFENADWSARDAAGRLRLGNGRRSGSGALRDLGVAAGLLSLGLALGEGVRRRRRRPALDEAALDAVVGETEPSELSEPELAHVGAVGETGGVEP